MSLEYGPEKPHLKKDNGFWAALTSVVLVGSLTVYGAVSAARPDQKAREKQPLQNAVVVPRASSAVSLALPKRKAVSRPVSASELEAEKQQSERQARLSSIKKAEAEKRSRASKINKPRSRRLSFNELIKREADERYQAAKAAKTKTRD